MFTAVTSMLHTVYLMITHGGPKYIAVGGAVETIITSVGGHAYTLATSGAGVATSIGGSEFTIVTSPTRSIS